MKVQALSCLVMAPVLFADAAKALLGADVATGEVVALDIYENDIQYTKDGVDELQEQVNQVKTQVNQVQAQVNQVQIQAEQVTTNDISVIHKFVENLSCIDNGRCGDEFDQLSDLPTHLVYPSTCSATNILLASDFGESTTNFPRKDSSCEHAYDGNAYTAWTMCDSRKETCLERSEGDNKLRMDFEMPVTLTALSWKNKLPTDEFAACIRNIQMYVAVRAATGSSGDLVKYDDATLTSACKANANIVRFNPPLSNVETIALEPIISQAQKSDGYFGISEVLFHTQAQEQEQGTGTAAATGR